MCPVFEVLRVFSQRSANLEFSQLLELLVGATIFKDLPLFMAYCDKEVLEKKVLHDHALKDTHLGLVERLDKVGSVSESFVQKFVLLLVLLVF